MSPRVTQSPINGAEAQRIAGTLAGPGWRTLAETGEITADLAADVALYAARRGRNLRTEPAETAADELAAYVLIHGARGPRPDWPAEKRRGRGSRAGTGKA